MRAETSRGLPAAYLSRQVAGVRKKALVVALPGSPKGAADCLTAILALVPHAIALVRGERPEHPAPAPQVRRVDGPVPRRPARDRRPAGGSRRPSPARRVGLITNPSGVTSGGVPDLEGALRVARRAARAALRARARRGRRRDLHGGGRRRGAPADGTARRLALRRHGREPEAARRRTSRGSTRSSSTSRTSGRATTPSSGRCCSRWRPARRRASRFVVCDRPNPIGGAVEGAPQDAGATSRSSASIRSPVRHGMTAGELARLLAAERRIGVDLHGRARSTGWARETPFEETGLPWVSPSPNIPSPGDGARLSGDVPARRNEPVGGAGHDAPLRALRRALALGGAFAGALNGLGLPGRRASCPTHFRPMFDKHAGQTCGGALLRGDRRRGVPLLRDGPADHRDRAARRARRDFSWRTEPYEFDRAAGDRSADGLDAVPRDPRRGGDLGAEIARHDAGAARVPRRAARRFLLYPDRRPAVVAFVGAHNAGKTTLIVRARAAADGARASRSGRSSTRRGTPRTTCRARTRTATRRPARRVAAFVTPGRTTARRFGPEEELTDAASTARIRRLRSRARRGVQVAPGAEDRGRRARAIAGVAGRGSRRARLRRAAPRTTCRPCRSSDRRRSLETVLRLAGLRRAPG